ncbi:S49 family peptidase [Roseomonas sp. NAR14]|uniref:S49 family peptidase n=1 Tax=Roseomonas acroporae TaxID=2937791 RepID=A0A9X1YD91_9PROT|nr:S49 family peptidase [Roseomonas acroporae]MCK8787645.1 S49 family peptidase [Roseomonas acroporae]
MRHERFLRRLLNRPQMITPAAGAAVLGALLPGSRLDGYDEDGAPVARDPREYTQVGDMAIIPVVGELIHRGSWMDAMSGLTSYQALQDQVSTALTDPRVGSLMLDIDSPGGEAAGCLDFAEWLAGQRGAKPIWASVNQLACSAAYAIASAADRILIGQSAYAGSIGVVAYHTDLSRAMEKQGVAITYVYAGAQKIDGNPTEPLPDDVRDKWQAEVDADYSRFCAVVAANRGLSVAAVRGTEAAVFRGQDAIDAGLADTIATNEEAIMALATTTAPVGASLSAAARRGRLQAGKAKASDAAPEDDAQPEAPAEPETPPQVPPSPPVPESPPEDPAAPADDIPGGGIHPPPSPDQPVVEPARLAQAAPAGALADACATAGHPELIAGLLRRGASMTEVKADIVRAQTIAKTGQTLGMQVAAAQAIAGGCPAEVFATVAHTAKAEADGARRTDTGNRAGTPKAATGTLDPAAIYGRMNARGPRASKGH